MNHHGRRWLVMGAVALGLVGLAIVVLAARASRDTAVSDDGPTSAATSGRDYEQEEYMAKNADRKNDALRLLGAVSEYQANNNGQLPSVWRAGYLAGSDEASTTKVELKVYKVVSFATGVQAPLAADGLRLVTAAACESNGATSASSSRAAAVQYGSYDMAGKLMPYCEDL
jgi:hypothetical protein